MSHWVHHAVHVAAHEKKDPKAAGVALIVVGLFFTPWIVGIPILIYGICKLFSSPGAKRCLPASGETPHIEAPGEGGV